MATEDTLSGFILTCNSCAARLKVSKPSLIGQMLACPKCGTMLKVTPPPNLRQGTPSTTPFAETGVTETTDPRQMPHQPDHPTEVKTELTTSDFEEIELLLKKNPELADPGTLPGPKFRPVHGSHSKASLLGTKGGLPKTHPSSDSSSVKPSPMAGSTSGGSHVTPTGSPLLPSDQWVSAAAQKRRRMTSLLAGAIGLILVLLTIVVAMLNGFGANTKSRLANSEDVIPSNPQTILVDTEQPDAKPEPADSSPAVTEDNRNVSENSNGDIADDTNSTTDGNKGIEANLLEKRTENDLQPDEIASDNADVETLNEEQPPFIPENMDEPPPVLPVEVQPNINEHRDSPSPSNDDTTLPDISDRQNAGQSQIRQSNLDSSLSNLDRLSQLADGSQLSVGRFRDLAASAMEEQKVGIPQYLIERNKQARPDVSKQLAIPCESLKYEPTPLLVVLHDLMLVTAVPISIDVESIIAQHGTASPLVELNAQSIDFAKAIDLLTESIALNYQTTENQGIIIVAANREELIEATYELPKFPIGEGELLEEVVNEFRAIVQGMIYPESWKSELNPSRFTVSDSMITVINTRAAQLQTKSLIEKLHAAIAVTGQAIDDPKWSTLRTVGQQIDNKLDQPSGLEHRFAEPLLDVMASLSTNTGVTLLADWEKLAPLGFDPLTIIPGTIAGGNLRSILRELTMALAITYVVVDEHTILLTTFDDAALRSDVEVYSFKKILTGKVNEDQALVVIKNSLAAELSHPLVRTYYDKRIQCLIVSAPQLVQRKIEKIVKALEET